MYGVTRMETSGDIALVSFWKIPLDLTVLSEIFSSFARAGINIDMISQSTPTCRHTGISFTCRDRDMVQVLEVSKALSEKYPNLRPMVSSGNCKIQLYGEEMREATGVFARAMECLRDSAVELQQVSTSEVDISLLVGAAHLDEAEAALKKAFDLE